MAKLIIALPDTHFNEHDPAAIECVTRVIRRENPHTLIQLGDGRECGALSAHAALSPKDKVHSVLEEAAEFNRHLDLWTKDDRNLVLLEGNHEERTDRWAVKHGSVLGNDLSKVLSSERLVRHRIDENGAPGKPRKNMKWVPYRGKGLHSHHLIAKDLIAIHGWSYAKNVAQVHLDAAKCRSVIFGHCHRKQEVTSRDPITGQIHHAWCPGTLSKLVPSWQAHSPNNWAHGFSMIYVGRKSWTHYNVTINNGCCVLPSGTEIRA